MRRRKETLYARGFHGPLADVLNAVKAELRREAGAWTSRAGAATTMSIVAAPRSTASASTRLDRPAPLEATARAEERPLPRKGERHCSLPGAWGRGPRLPPSGSLLHLRGVVVVATRPLIDTIRLDRPERRRGRRRRALPRSGLLGYIVRHGSLGYLSAYKPRSAAMVVVRPFRAAYASDRRDPICQPS